MASANSLSVLATAVLRTMLGSERFWLEPAARNSNLLPVKARGEVRLRSVVSLLRLGSTGTPRSMDSLPWDS